MKIKNGVKKFYALKDKNLMKRVKGSIQLEINLHYNPVC